MMRTRCWEFAPHSFAQNRSQAQDKRATGAIRSISRENHSFAHTKKQGIARKTNERIPNPAAQLLMTECQLMLSLISHMCEVNDYSDSGWTNILLLKIKIKSYQTYI